MIEVYSAGTRIRRVRFAMLLSLFCAVGGCWLAWTMWPVTGPGIEDDGRLWGTVSAAFGAAFAVGMWVYGRHYVRTILYDRTRHILHIRTFGMFGDRFLSLPANDVQRSTYSSGRLINPWGVSVNAPWFNIWLVGRRWPLILDARGQIANEELLRRLLKG